MSKRPKKRCRSCGKRIPKSAPSQCYDCSGSGRNFEMAGVVIEIAEHQLFDMPTSSMDFIVRSLLVEMAVEAGGYDLSIEDIEDYHCINLHSRNVVRAWFVFVLDLGEVHARV